MHFFLIAFLCCCVFVVKQSLNNWTGEAWPDWLPLDPPLRWHSGSRTVCLCVRQSVCALEIFWKVMDWFRWNFWGLSQPQETIEFHGGNPDHDPDRMIQYAAKGNPRKCVFAIFSNPLDLKFNSPMEGACFYLQAASRSRPGEFFLPTSVTPCLSWQTVDDVSTRRRANCRQSWLELLWTDFKQIFFMKF